MALITFACTSPVASWAPTVNPKYGAGYRRSKTRHQPRDFSDAGDLYSYSRGTKTNRTLIWDTLPAADMTALLAFIDAMSGGVTTFVFTDYDATTYTARIMNTSEFKYAHYLRQHFALAVELEVS